MVPQWKDLSSRIPLASFAAFTFLSASLLIIRAEVFLALPRTSPCSHSTAVLFGGPLIAGIAGGWVPSDPHLQTHRSCCRPNALIRDRALHSSGVQQPSDEKYSIGNITSFADLENLVKRRFVSPTCYVELSFAPSAFGKGLGVMK